MINEVITSEDAVEELYAKGKVCLTAHKEANIDKKYRPYLALFADGTFLVDERAQTDVVLQNLFIDFCNEYFSKKRKAKQYVSPQMLKAVYRKAQDFDWYEPQYASWKDLTAAERSKMRQFWRRTEDKTCLSVTTITTPEVFRFYSPDKGKFALFADGWLTLAEDSPYLEELPRALSKLYPETNMVEIVPPHYVEMIYDCLLYRQPSAREIYIDLCMLKMCQKMQVSRKEALDIMQKQISGWSKLLLLDEKTARSMIYSEFVEKTLAQNDKRWADIMAAKKEYLIGKFL